MYDRDSAMAATFSNWLVVGTFAVVAACAKPPPNVPVPHATATSNARARVVLAVAHAESRFLGENVLVDYCLENTSTTALVVHFGGDYRGASRSTRFEMTVTDARGATVPDPDPHPNNLGGLSMAAELEPGRSYCTSLPLHRFARIDAPGTYRISVTHDAGLPLGQAPTGETSVTLTMPTPVQAERVVETMATTKGVSGSWGKTLEPYPDFSALRYPVYVPSLVLRARAGDVRMLEGLSDIPDLEAARALLVLLGHRTPAIALAAAQALVRRLPHVPTGNAALDEIPAARRYLARVGWASALEAPLRAELQRLLSSKVDEELVSGALILQAIGTPRDAALLLDGLGRAITKTTTSPREDRPHPPRGAARPLVQAGTFLVARGFVTPNPPHSEAEIAVWLEAFRLDARPRGWEGSLRSALHHPNLYVRRVALESMSGTVPPGFASDVGENLEVRDPDVNLAATRLAVDAKLTELGPKLTHVLRTTNDEYLFQRVWAATSELGGRYPAALALAERLADPKLGQTSLAQLLELVEEHPRTAAELTPARAADLKKRWLTFLPTRKEAITAGREIPRAEVPPELIPD